MIDGVHVATRNQRIPGAVLPRGVERGAETARSDRFAASSAGLDRSPQDHLKAQDPADTSNTCLAVRLSENRRRSFCNPPVSGSLIHNQAHGRALLHFQCFQNGCDLCTAGPLGLTGRSAARNPQTAPTSRTGVCLAVAWHPSTRCSMSSSHSEPPGEVGSYLPPQHP